MKKYKKENPLDEVIVKMLAKDSKACPKAKMILSKIKKGILKINKII